VSSPPPSPPPRRRALGYWLPLLVWVLVMLYFTSAPDPYAQFRAQGTTLSNVIGHFLGFVVLMLLALRWWCFRTGERTGRRVWQAVALCLLYALLDELHQIPIPGRSFAVVDLLTDAAGIAVGVLLSRLRQPPDRT